MTEELCRLYEKTVENNISYLKKLEKELLQESNLPETFHRKLTFSSKQIADRWRSEEKYLRTKYAKFAIPDYPEDMILPSISIDATVNLIDDILDENLSKDQKALYIVELIRVLNLKHSFPLSYELKKLVSDYFNKIIFVAIAESTFYPQMLKEKNKERFFDLTFKSYLSRSLDMDIFIELPLMRMNVSIPEIKEVMDAGKAFRIMNLAKKDFLDLEHDLEHEITTPITIFKEKKIPVDEFVPYLYTHSTRRVSIPTSRFLQKVIKNFIAMAKKEKKTLEESIK